MPRHGPGKSFLLRLLLGASLLASSGCNDRGAPAVPEEVIRHNILGTAYLGQQKWSEALTEFRQALELHPGDPLLLTNMAVALIQRGDLEEAASLLRQALAADPDYPYAHYNLGLIENQNANFESAAEHFGVVARHDPQDLFTRYYLGSVLSRVGREDDAVQSFRAALERDPSHVSSLYGLGRLLIQRGEQEEGLRLISLSQQIRDRSGLDAAVGGQYGEQGPYALGIDYTGGDLVAPEAIAVRFEAATTIEVPPGSAPAWTLARLGPTQKPAFLVVAGATLTGLAPAGLDELAPPAPAGAETLGLTAGDLDNDGRVDLVALLAAGEAGGPRDLAPALLTPEGENGFRWADRSAWTGAGPSRLGAGATADLALVDRDHDGDLDLFWCWSRGTEAPAGCRLATNDGQGRLETHDSADHGFSLDPDASGSIDVSFSDADNDRDVDLIVASSSAVRLFTNQRDGSFGDVSGPTGLASIEGSNHPMVVADLDKDGWMDLLLGAGDTLLVNRRGRFERSPGPGTSRPPAEPSGLVVFDYDNDGFLDVVRAGAAFRNLGGGRWSETPGLLPSLTPPAVPLAALDADEDGDLDLAVLAGSELRLLRNEGGNTHHWIALDSRGVGDNRFGIGARVELLAGALRQKFEITLPLPLHAGLGSRQTLQSARYLWPSGVLQDEVEIASNTRTEIRQLDRKGTSCPLLYAWTGGAWRFVTDFLGGCAVGYLHAPGLYSTPDTDEYVRIEGGLETDERGLLRLRLNNQLEEVLWFDQVELVAVDHPAGTQVFPNERLMPAPPWPEFELFASRTIRPIVSAHSLETGLDVTERLALVDRRYVDDFALERPKGYAAWHTLEIDPGRLPDGRVVLLLDGWIDYADSTANLAASQSGLELIPPRLWVADGRGGWSEIHGLMGFPAGLPKTMSVELTGLLASSDARLRIGTNMRIYWEQARVLLGGEETELRVRRLSPLAAELGFGGFPREISPDGRKPFGYDPDDVAPHAPWKAHVGRYTPFGDVRELLSKVDDRFVTTRSGDQIDLRFPAAAPLDAGWERTFLLHADGFGKDMDPNSAASDTVGPVPFHGMPTYPYPIGVVPPNPVEDGPGRRVLESAPGWPGAPPLPPLPRSVSAVDLLIRGGTLVDGTGAGPRRADVAVKDGRIVEIGLVRGAASRTIDASGLVVAPGFIDLHSHADLILLGDEDQQERSMAAKISQGVTTVVVGNCGLGVAPATVDAAEILAGVNGWMTPLDVVAGALSTREYLDHLEEVGVVVNVGSLIPHGPVRISTLGLTSGAASPEQLAAMRRTIEDGLEAGAFGLSVGLIYPPGMYSATDELVELARPVAARQRLFTAHVRGSSETLLQATRELIDIGRRSGARVHHSHLEAVGERFWPDVAAVLDLEDRARASGLAISHDVFPYTRAATMMSAIFPPWAMEGGLPALLERLSRPEVRGRLKQEVEHGVPEWPPWRPGGWPHNLVAAVGWDGIRVATTGTEASRGLIGRSLESIAAAEHREPFDVVADLMIAERGQVGQLVDEISGRDDRLDALYEILAHPAGAIVSDAEDYGRGTPHPAHAGAFARALRLQREGSLGSLQDVVRRMTGYPAALAGIDDRGTIRPGAAADLVVFDPETVGDRAGWDEPSLRATGIHWVVINGSVVLEDGRYRGGLKGSVLRAPGSPPAPAAR